MSEPLTVLLHFGDGSFQEIPSTKIDPDDAVAEVKRWVLDNAWLQVEDPETGEVLAEVSLYVF